MLFCCRKVARILLGGMWGIFATAQSHSGDTLATCHSRQKASANEVNKTPSTSDLFKVVKPTKEQSLFKEHHGKVLRHIHIKVYSPLGYSQLEVSSTPNKWEQMGNKLHRNTRQAVVRNLLEIKEHATIDTAQIAESERLLRTQSFIRRANITPIATHSPDTLDVQVTVLDAWSIYSDVQGSSKGLSLSLQEYNFLGIGHRLQGLIGQEMGGGLLYGGAYTIPNIYRTHARFRAYYTKNQQGHFSRGVSFVRPFYSLYARWAAGIQLMEQSYKHSITIADTLYTPTLQEQQTDLWVGVAFPLKNNKAGAGVSRILLSGRANRLHYPKAFPQKIDPLGHYATRHLLLASLAISQVRYLQERYIYRHSEVEYIPAGLYAAATAGISFTQQKQPYIGLQGRWGEYFSLGYCALALHVGSFVREKQLSQAAIGAEAVYFSPLLHALGWKLRHFSSFGATMGFWRKEFAHDRIGLASSISGFDSPTLLGKHKAILTLQTQWYAPSSFWGFRISPFFTTQAGLIWGNDQPLWRHNFVSKFAVGFYITNDYLHIGSIEFSLFYFPKIPGVGRHIAQFSGLGSRAFRLPSYDFALPALVPYH